MLHGVGTNQDPPQRRAAGFDFFADDRRQTAQVDPHDAELDNLATLAANQQARAAVVVAFAMLVEDGHVDHGIVIGLNRDGHVGVVSEKRLIVGRHVVDGDEPKLAEFGERREEGGGDRLELRHERISERGKAEGTSGVLGVKWDETPK